MALRLDDLVDALTDHLVRAVAIKPLRRPVPADDRSVERRRRDRIVCGLDNRGNFGELLVPGPHLTPEQLALTDTRGEPAEHEEREHSDETDDRERLKLVARDVLGERQARRDEHHRAEQRDVRTAQPPPGLLAFPPHV